MYHNFVLVQKIQENSGLSVYFAKNDYINWTYEELRKPTSKTDTPLFPIIINDDNVQINEKKVGRETSCIRVNTKKIRFSDDYSIPEGFLICISGPIGYMPTVIKFKQKPLIMSEDYNKNIPGHFEILTNRSTRQASIIMHVLRRSYFGITVDFEESERGFDKSLRKNFYDPFDMTLSLINGKIENITTTQVSQLLPGVEHEQLIKLTTVLNELVGYMKNSSEGKEDKSIPINIKEKIYEVMNGLMSASSSVVTIVDSYHNNGFAAELIKSLVNFFS